MKRLSFTITILAILTLSGVGTRVAAEGSPGDVPFYDGLYYEFTATVNPDDSVEADYYTNYAQIAVPAGTGWSARVVRESGALLSSYDFNPQQMANGAQSFVLSIPYFPNAADVQFVRPDGSLATTVSTRQSRVCDENRVCDGQSGEDTKNCPFDCGAPYVPRTAAISDAAGTSGRIGSIAVRVLAALAGLGVLALIVRMLDSGGAKRDNSSI
jgi:hypothetical protein